MDHVCITNASAIGKTFVCSYYVFLDVALDTHLVGTFFCTYIHLRTCTLLAVDTLISLIYAVSTFILA